MIGTCIHLRTHNRDLVEEFRNQLHLEQRPLQVGGPPHIVQSVLIYYNNADELHLIRTILRKHEEELPNSLKHMVI